MPVGTSDDVATIAPSPPQRDHDDDGGDDEVVRGVVVSG